MTTTQKEKSIPFDEKSGRFEFKGHLSVDWDHEKKLKIVKEQWMDVDTQEDKIVSRTITYPDGMYQRQQLPRFGNSSKVNKGVTTLGEEVFMEWSPHLFRGKNSHYVDNYIKEYTDNISKGFPDKLVINNEIQPDGHYKTLPDGKTWWDNEEGDEIMVKKEVFHPTQYYIDTYMIDYVNKHKKVRKRPGPLWKYSPNKFIGDDNVEKDTTPNSNQEVEKAPSFVSNSNTFVPLHRRRNFRSKYSDNTNDSNDNSKSSGSFIAPHLRRGGDTVKYSIKLYDFASLDGIEPKDILDWIREYNVMGYIKITIPKSRRTGKVCTFAFLNFKNELDKTNALKVLTGLRLKFNHSIVSVEDASNDKGK
jgi:hypothetical protein